LKEERLINATLVLALLSASIIAPAQTSPPWSKGTNNPAVERGESLQVDDVDNVPDLHGNPESAKLVLFVGGNQFFVMPRLIAGFEHAHPELRGGIFYETLPPGVLRNQMEHGGTLTLGNLTLHVLPDVYEAGGQTLTQMQQQHKVDSVVSYATNDLEIMVVKGNPKHIKGLADLASAGLRLSMPNPQTEGVARQIAASLKNSGGDHLREMVYGSKVTDGTSYLTQIHHRQTPMRLMQGKSDAGVVWASEVRFQEKIGNPIEGIRIPESENITAVYAAGVVTDAPHRTVAEAWVRYLSSEEGQNTYREFGFKPFANEHRAK